MRKALHRKIITCYILIGILSFFLATAGGSHFVEMYLEEELGERLYDSASHLASDDVIIEQLSSSDRSSLQKVVDLLSVSEDAELLILDDTRHLLVQSADNHEHNTQKLTSEFSEQDWIHKEYQIGTFYDCFPHISAQSFRLTRVMHFWAISPSTMICKSFIRNEAGFLGFYSLFSLSYTDFAGFSLYATKNGYKSLWRRLSRALPNMPAATCHTGFL